MTFDEALEQFHPSDANAVDTIDAALFSGDAFTNAHKRQALRTVMARWERRLVELAELEEV